MKKILNIALLSFLAQLALPAFAEKADKDKPLHIDADKLEVDDAKKESIFQGNVVMTQGTLVLRAEKITVQENPAGFKHAVAYGNPVFYRQKREGLDEYVEGEGMRAEYDSKTDTVEFFDHALVRRGGDEVRGNSISYNSSTDFFKSEGGAKGSGGRVHAVIQPKKKEAAEKQPPLPLESTPSMQNPQ